MPRTIQSVILSWPRPIKRLVVIVMDTIMAVAAMWMAFTLRLDTLHWPQGAQWWIYALGPVLAVPVFVRFGLYRAIFRYTGLAALIATTQATALYALMLFLSLILLQRLGYDNVPRSMGILQPTIFLLFVGTSRALARSWLAGQLRPGRRSNSRLIIYGAGAAGAQMAAALSSARQPMQLCGFVDDDVAKVGRTINDIVVYAPSQLPALVSRLGLTDILLALPSVTRARRNEIVTELRSLPVHVRTVPGLSDLATGRVTFHDMLELDIEDLLGREPVPPQSELLARNLADKVVLVTGAGGSIGSELCRQILLERPTRILLLDHSEFALYSIHSELSAIKTARSLDVDLVPLLGSVVNYGRIAALCHAWRPDTIYHAAAYKHVPLVEGNPAEGVVNNVLGTLNLARAAIETKVSNFVLISTDKAVRPTNVMGASKRVAEQILQALAATDIASFDGPLDAGAVQVKNGTRFCMVRFGNVLGSSGSVVPLFRRQLATGGPLTVTHADVTRYFMTIAEAAQLVLQAGAMAEGGDVFVLDMGEPIKIYDLAARMVRLSGLTVRNDQNPTGDIQIAITGLRPGEKLYEELLIGNNPRATDHPRIMRAHEEHFQWLELRQPLQNLIDEARHGERQQMLRTLNHLVPGLTLDDGLTFRSTSEP